MTEELPKTLNKIITYTITDSTKNYAYIPQT